MSTDLDAAVARLEERCRHGEMRRVGVVSADVRLLLADWKRLREMTSPAAGLARLEQELGIMDKTIAERDAARAEVERLSVQVAASAQGPLHELLGMCGGVDRCAFCGRIGPHVEGCKAPAIEALVRLAWVDVPDWDRWWSPADYADHEAELARLRERDARVSLTLQRGLAGATTQGKRASVRLDWCVHAAKEALALLKETP